MEWAITELERCDSTQDALQAMADDGAPEGTVVVAPHMAEGRGTHGRVWHAPEGGLYLSFLLRDPVDPQYLTLAVGNAVADVLEVAGVEPQMRWVNDVLVDGKKIAGILVESSSTGNKIDAMCIGIGINANGDSSDWPHPLSQSATTMEDVLGAESCIPDLQTYLLQTLDTWIHRLRSDGPASIVEAWQARDALRGTRIGFDPDGDLCAKVVGIADGIDAEGRLCINVDGEIQAFRSGSVC